MAAVAVQNFNLCGPLEGATNVGTVGEPGEGAYVRIWLEVDGGRIRRAAYATHPCPHCATAAAMTATIASGRTLEEASRITAADINILAGGLPDGRGHFADMSALALKRAMEQTI